MSILFVAPGRNLETHRKAMLELDPNLDVEIWPNVKDNKRINFAVAWDHPKEVFRQYPNLKVISSLGAGVDHLVSDSTIPEDITLTRLVGSSLKEQMAEFVEAASYNFIRKLPQYFEQQIHNRWKVLPHVQKRDINIGILGLGEIGSFTAESLAANQWNVNGWSRRPKKLEGVEIYSGIGELGSFLKETNLAVCLLPLTQETENIMDLELFKQLRKPAGIINTGRGEHLVEEDLVYALDADIIELAFLDVFEKEPLPDSHPFWNRHSIIITPHIAAPTDPAELAEQIVENYKRLLSGLKLKHVVSREKGY